VAIPILLLHKQTANLIPVATPPLRLSQHCCHVSKQAISSQQNIASAEIPTLLLHKQAGHPVSIDAPPLRQYQHHCPVGKQAISSQYKPPLRGNTNTAAAA